MMNTWVEWVDHLVLPVKLLMELRQTTMNWNKSIIRVGGARCVRVIDRRATHLASNYREAPVGDLKKIRMPLKTR